MMTGKQLKALRKKANLTQKQVAELMGATHQTISKYESDAVLPDTKMEFVSKFYQNLEKYKKESIDSVFEERSKYQNFEKIENSQGILESILAEIKEVRKENEQLRTTIAQHIEDSDKERKLNELSRTQFNLAVGVMKSLDRDIEELQKSTGTKQDVSKAK
ncbi:helix-turn-helix domain-containing protein [Chryseobacterium terrae]|uniref:Helix-turn-helix domain-containing protein n=1 Tax=Chryseobacterium terrae TaxID=3163299 RepID=A0ABW8Y6W3_9FLAO